MTDRAPAKKGSTPETPFPLREVSHHLQNWIGRLGAVWVEGQLIQLNRRPGTWQYLTLRDTLADMSLSATATTLVLDAAGPITEGATVTALLKPTFWPKGGRLSMDCLEIRASGEGRLLAQLEQRRRMLQAEGLFDPSLKKRLPFLPRAIGLITAQDSAAEHDVFENVHNRWPGARIITAHALMQGPNCVEQVIDRLVRLDQHPEVDVIIIARGGGSVEDLLPFSDESLVRTAYQARTPIVSAIGHESDRPIIDLVADLRASTPTDAAKRVVPDAREEADRVEQARQRMRRAVVQLVTSEQQRLDTLTSRPVLRDPAASFAVHDERLAMLRGRLARGVDAALTREEALVDQLLARVRAMSPKATLERGYAILHDDEDTITSVHQVEAGQPILAYLADGQLELLVEEITASARASQEEPL